MNGYTLDHNSIMHTTSPGHSDFGAPQNPCDSVQYSVQYSGTEAHIGEEDAVCSWPLSMRGDEELGPGTSRRKWQGSQRNYPSKMMKPWDDSTPSNVTVMTESISDCHEKRSTIEGVVPDSALSMPGATRTSSSTGGQNTFPESRNSQMKIKSFTVTVPEFVVEIPDTAPFLSVKRIINEKATAEFRAQIDAVLLGSMDVNLGSKPSQAVLSLCPQSDPFQFPCSVPDHLAGYSPTPTLAVDHQGTHDTSPGPLISCSRNNVRADHELGESQTNMFTGQSTSSSREVIALPAMNLKSLDMGPVHLKFTSSKNVKHRGVSSDEEIEVVKLLIAGVATFGLGRWQMIKERLFQNAENWTPANLKDKWKSLVNKAKRPANQRRGAVLDQQILNRVLDLELKNSQLQGMQE